MMMDSGNHRTPGLRTYSKRDNLIPETLSSKRRRVEVTSTAKICSPAPESLPPPRKIPRSSIQNYFRPRARPSSLPPPLSASLSSDSTEAHEALTPPSSPPAVEARHIHSPNRAQKRPRRRLTKKLPLPLVPDMSYRKTLYFGGELDDIGSAGYREQACQPRPRRIESTRPQPSVPRAKDLPNDTGAIPSKAPSYEGPGPVITDTPGIDGVKVADKLDNWSYSTRGPYEHWQSSTPPRLTKPPRELLPDKTWASYPPDVDPELPSAAIDIPPRPRKKPRSATYTQTQIDLGLSNTIHCDKCEMSYNSSITEDTLEHRRYCKLRAMPELQKKEMREGSFVWKDIIDGAHHRIRVVTTHSHPEQRAIAEVILKRTLDDLPGLQYTSDDLWFPIQNPLNPKDVNQVPRFKLYTYYIDSKVFGVLLVERYTMEHAAKNEGSVVPDAGSKGLSKHLVFDRLWVLTTARRKGYARRLADTARDDFIQGLHVRKDQVMMSEPTSNGRKWAARYFAG